MDAGISRTLSFYGIFTFAVNTSDHYASRGSLFRGWDYLCSVFYFSSVNYYKKIFRNEALFPNDFIQASQLKEVIPMIKDSISIPIVIGVIGSISY